MFKKKKLLFLVYFFIFLEIILLLTEFILNLKGLTLCKSYGCEILDQFIKIDRPYFLILGLLYFLCMLLFIYLYHQTKGNLFRLSILLFLGGGFSAELIFSFRQLIEVNLLCSFCLTVAFLFFLIFIFSLLVLALPFSLSEMSFFTIGIFLGLTFSFYLTAINLKPLTNLETQNNFLLIYSDNCLHCKEVIESFKNNHLTLTLIQADFAYPLMKKLNLNQVPILIHQRSKGNLEFFVGKNQILEFLNTLTFKAPLIEGPKNLPKIYRSSKRNPHLLEGSCENETQGVCEVR
ncbi:MAG: hypothetical protein NZ530_04370 [Thermodesulfobacteriaceae bacterium]|nr:hypothetical protein [Thermodesulfobacteriaceae bacterium]MDW8136195.1 hypothetical protein [Thermodesulfobacterium sp.]